MWHISKEPLASFTRQTTTPCLSVLCKQAFLDKLSADGKAPTDNTLIGRFGVGFYSAFMVAEKIDVFTNSGEGLPLKWSSAGDGQYSIRAAAPEEAPERGTRMVLHLKEDAKTFSYRAEARCVFAAHDNALRVLVQKSANTVTLTEIQLLHLHPIVSGRWSDDECAIIGND